MKAWDMEAMLEHTGEATEENLKKYKYNIHDIWDTIKRLNQWITGIQRIQAKGIENIFNKIRAQNFTILEKEMVIQEAFRALNKQEISPHYIIVKT
jgi:hypothetical protein